jgi:N-acetylglutamate synthase-like GNAT family acetyltransferase
MDINNARLEDINIIKKIFNDTLVKIGGYIFSLYSNTDTIKRKILKNNMFVVLDNNKIIGVFSLRWYKKSCEIISLAIIEEYRENGIGREIINYIIKLSTERDIKIITVWTFKGFNAVNFYIKCNFRKVFYDYISESYFLEKRI